MKTQWIPLPVTYPCSPQKTGGSVLMDEAVHEKINRLLKAPEPPETFREQGGILGCDREGRITAFHFDGPGSGRSDACRYLPDSTGLESVARQWQAHAISFCGMIHTHSDAMDRLSRMDMLFAKSLLEDNRQLRKLYMPVLAGSRLTVYAFTRDCLSRMEQTERKVRHYDKNAEQNRDRLSGRAAGIAGNRNPGRHDPGSGCERPAEEIPAEPGADPGNLRAD